MASFVPKARAAAGRRLLDQINGGAKGPGPTVVVEVRLTEASRVTLRDLPELPDDAATQAVVQHMVGRARARMEDDMIAAAYGQPMRHEMKPAKIVRVR